MENTENKEPQVNEEEELKDLPVFEAEEVKGGATLKFSPWITRNKKGDGSVVDNPVELADLEPRGDVVGGLGMSYQRKSGEVQ